MENILKQELLKLEDKEYAKFNKKLCPDTKLKMIGVRIPKIRELAKKLVKENDYEANIKSLIKSKDSYFEEVVLKGMILGYLKIDFKDKLDAIELFLPKIDSWAITDTFVPTFKLKPKDLKIAWNFILPFINDKDEFKVRFALIMMLDYFLVDEYIDKVLKEIDRIKHDGYYVKMAAAWVIAEIGVKYNEKAINYLTGTNYLDKFTYNKALQKMIESYRISDEQKVFLRSLKKK